MSGVEWMLSPLTLVHLGGGLAQEEREVKSSMLPIYSYLQGSDGNGS